ncbi:MAG: hypothetical protein WEA24_08395 [Gemmatimonadota bacterium]
MTICTRRRWLALILVAGALLGAAEVASDGQDGSQNQFGFIRDAALNPSGVLSVLDVSIGNNRAVVVLDSLGRRVSELPAGRADGQVSAATGLGTAPGGRLLVADWGNSHVSVFVIDEARRPVHTLTIDTGQAHDACGSATEYFVAAPRLTGLIHVYDATGGHVRSFGEPAVLDYAIEVNRQEHLLAKANAASVACDTSEGALYHYNLVLGRITKFLFDGSEVWTVRLEQEDFSHLEAGNGWCCGVLPGSSGRQLEGKMPLVLDGSVLRVSAGEYVGEARWSHHSYVLDAATGRLLEKQPMDWLPLGTIGGRSYNYLAGSPSRISVVPAGARK